MQRRIVSLGLLSIAACARTQLPSPPRVLHPGWLTPAEPPRSHVLRGGVYTDLPAPTFWVPSVGPHLIEVNFTKKTLHYYRGGEGVRGYRVITPDATTLNGRVDRGRVTAIDRTPSWCPTDNIRRVFRERGNPLPAGCLPFGHPRNAMGNVKFHIAGFGARRIHGTRGYSREWEDVETFGCVRLMNGRPGIDELVELLGPRAVEEGIEVVFYPG